MNLVDGGTQYPMSTMPGEQVDHVFAGQMGPETIHFLESVLLGATGWVSGLVNAFPAENRLLWDLATAGRWEEARAVYRWYTPLLHLDTHVKLVQYIKLCAQECGYGTEMVRAPRLPIVGEERKGVLDIIHKAIATRPAAALAAK